MARLYQAQGRYSEAEPLFLEDLQASREVLGPRHSGTLTSLNNLADLYQAQGRLAEAEPLYRDALQGRRDVLGPRHPDTLLTQLKMAGHLVNQGRRADAMPMLQQMEPHLLGWIRCLGEESPPLSQSTRRIYLVGLRRLLRDLASEGHPLQPELIRPEDSRLSHLLFGEIFEACIQTLASALQPRT